MTANGVQLSDAAEPRETRAAAEPAHRLRLIIMTSQASPGTLPEAWRSYAYIEDARASASEALRNPQVLGVAIVEDGAGLAGSANPLRFVEWVDR